MGLILLSVMVSMVLGACAWLVLGDQFPVKDELKWPATNNIACYSVILLVPVYLVIFFLN
ncbi:MAG: hypothetical protein O2780_00665 [Proteobacteria bacterium]|jgi:hypothetical protein|nr:hypothetical protein [Pseudomonadota bacterium]MDA1299832.1 hypothetical protein [Pseudomonadota bacterium]